MITRFLFFLLLVCVSGEAMAQFISGSPYAVYGIGDIRPRNSPLNRSMGGVGIAVHDSLNLNHVNPASYASIGAPVSMIYESGAYLESSSYSSTALSSQKYFGGLTNLNLWLKLKPFWGSTIGLSPYSDVSYHIISSQDLGFGKTDVDYAGTGGFTQVYWGNGFKITKNLSLGFNSSFVFGSITKKEKVTLSDAVTQFQNKISGHQLNLDAGLQYTIRLKKYKVTLGGIAQSGRKLKGTNKEDLIKGSDTLYLPNNITSIRYYLPGKLGGGFSIETSRSLLAADFQFLNWAKADFGEQNVTYNDVRQYSIGYMYKGNPQSEKYLSNVTIRSGFHYQNHFMKVENTPLNNWGMSFGLGMPVQRNRATLQATYTYDRLGTTANGLVKENSSKIMIDVILRDVWGIRRKFE